MNLIMKICLRDMVKRYMKMNKRVFGRINFEEKDIMLTVDIDLVVSDTPIFFACSDHHGNKYLVELLDENTFKYLIVLMKPEDILLMLNGSRTIYNSLRKGKKSWVVIESENETDVYNVEREISPSKLPNKYLPDKNLLYNFKFQLLSEYINRLENNAHK